MVIVTLLPNKYIMTMEQRKAERVQRIYNNVRIALLVILLVAMFAALYH